MQKFVLAGKASTVFHLIEMMARDEQGKKASSSPKVQTATGTTRFMGCYHAMGRR